MRPSSLYFNCTFSDFNGWRWNKFCKTVARFLGNKKSLPLLYIIFWSNSFFFFTLDDVGFDSILQRKYLIRLLVYISILSLGFLAMILEEEFFGEAVA